MTRREIYASSSSDTWHLVRDGERIFVLHQANLASGGSSREIDLDAFLAREKHSAENVALVRLIGTLAEARGPDDQTMK